MLSSKLVRLIESHWEPLTNAIVRQIRGDLRLDHVGRLPDSELRERGRDILERLGHWLTVSGEHELARHFGRVGATLLREDIPLAEVVLAYSIIKKGIIDYVRAQGIGPDTMELYAEEELEHEAGRFFDAALYHLVRGHEEAAANPLVAHAGSR